MNKTGLTAAIGLTLGTSSPIGGEALASGLLQPPRVEAADTFECPDIRATVRYREDRIEPDTGVPLEDTLRVTLLELTASGASLPADQLATAREVFRSFAWVSNVNALCYAGHITILVEGMPHGLFFEAITDDDDDGSLPRLRTSTIVLSASGVTRVEPFDPRDEALRYESRP